VTKWVGTYEDYLWSPWWRRHVRRQALHRANHTCQRCGRRATEVHHLTYERLGNEHPDDLQPLCDDCHRAAHGLPPLYNSDFSCRKDESLDDYVRRVMEIEV
jgi:5-methylcytosine-specific restriction endonuclease McrA